MFYRITLPTYSLLFIFLIGCTTSEKEKNKEYAMLISEIKAKIPNETEKEVEFPSTLTDSLIVRDVLDAVAHYTRVDSLNSKSTALFEQSVSAVEKSNNKGLKYWVYSEVGAYYYRFSNYLCASPYFIELSQALRQNSVEIDIERSSVLLKSAYFFDTMQEYALSKQYYQELVVLHKEDARRKGVLYYALGNVALLQGNLLEATDYLELSGKEALLAQDSLRYAKSRGGLGVVYAQRGQSAKALTLLLEDIALSKQLGEERNLMYAQIQLGKLYLDLGQDKVAKEVFEQAYKIAQTKAYLIGFEGEIVTFLIEIAAREGDDVAELDYRKKFAHLESLMKNKEGDYVIQEVNWKADYARIRGELEYEKETLAKVMYQRLFLVFLIAFLVVSAFLLYRYYKGFIKQQKLGYEAKLLSFRLDKITSENKLKETHKTLHDYHVYLTEKTEQIKGMEQELDNLKKTANEDLNEQRASLEELIQSHLMTDENWQLFKETFYFEQPEYMCYLAESFPSLTETNLRIVLLQKLELTNQETADLLGVTIDAVKKAKQRMRKKYGEEYAALFSEPI